MHEKNVKVFNLIRRLEMEVQNSYAEDTFIHCTNVRPVIMYVIVFLSSIPFFWPKMTNCNSLLCFLKIITEPV